MIIRALFFVLWLACGAWADEKFIYDDHHRRDPFWRLVSPSGAIVSYDDDLLIADVILEGIIFDPAGKSLAIINGNIVAQNEKIGPYVISAIEPQKVILQKGQEDFVLELKKLEELEENIESKTK